MTVCWNQMYARWNMKAAYWNQMASDKHRNSALDWFLAMEYDNFTMNITQTPSTTTGTTPLVPFGPMTTALGHPIRWRIMAELSDGEPLMVTEIAKRIGLNADMTSKHLATLRKAGMVVSGQARLYRIPKQYLPVPGQRVVDYGYCLLRLNVSQ